jgi:uncharacterized membrane protein YgcG
MMMMMMMMMTTMMMMMMMMIVTLTRLTLGFSMCVCADENGMIDFKEFVDRFWEQGAVTVMMMMMVMVMVTMLEVVVVMMMVMMMMMIFLMADLFQRENGNYVPYFIQKDAADPPSLLTAVQALEDTGRQFEPFTPEVGDDDDDVGGGGNDDDDDGVVDDDDGGGSGGGGGGGDDDHDDDHDDDVHPLSLLTAVQGWRTRGGSLSPLLLWVMMMMMI